MESTGWHPRLSRQGPRQQGIEFSIHTIACLRKRCALRGGHATAAGAIGRIHRPGPAMTTPFESLHRRVPFAAKIDVGRNPDISSIKGGGPSRASSESAGNCWQISGQLAAALMLKSDSEAASTSYRNTELADQLPAPVPHCAFRSYGADISICMPTHSGA